MGLAHQLDMVRDSKNPTGPTLRFGHNQLAVFLGEVRAGRFDGSRAAPSPQCRLSRAHTSASVVLTKAANCSAFMDIRIPEGP